jgi:HAD superfamily hydrolase (TIGR01549 family)
MSIKAVIFDLDGTITEPFFDFDMIRAEMGLTREDGPVWEAMAKMPADRRKELEAILHYHEQKGVDESQLNAGAKETLDWLKKRSIKIGILTRNQAKNAWAIAEKHNVTFDEVLGREDGPIKPNCYGVLELCRRFAVEPNETLMVGDYLFDVQCANEAGAVSVLLANHEQADEFAAHADFAIDRIDEIIEIIEQNSDYRPKTED